MSKEKITIKMTIKERAAAAPKELLRRGAVQGSGKLQQELKEAAQPVQSEETQKADYAGQVINAAMPRMPKMKNGKSSEQQTSYGQHHNYYEYDNGYFYPKAPGTAMTARPQYRNTTYTVAPQRQLPSGEPLALPVPAQPSATERGREDYRKKMVQKRAAQNKTTPTDPESVGGSLSAEEAKPAEIRHTDGKSADQTPRTKEAVLANTPKQPTQATTSKVRTATSVPAKNIAPVKSTPKAVQAATPKTAKALKVKEPAKAVSTVAKKPTRASIAVQKAARKAGKNASKVAQKSAKQAASDALRAIVAGIKSMIVALGAGGTAVVAIVLVLVLVGGILASPLGIFFSGSVDNELTLQRVMGQINTEFSQMITDIENSVPHDDVEQTGRRTLWKDVLAVYAVKVSTDAEDPLEVATMDEERAALIREIFMAMNTIDYYTEDYTEEVTEEVTDEDGNVTEETQTVERIRLVIVISGKSAEEMAAEYEFDEEQLGFLTELLSEEYEELWYGLPYGGGSDDIVAVALLQVGNVGGEPYWSWYGYSSRVAWCACFVSWCGATCS